LSKCMLVTGAAGFIGSHVTLALLKRGDRVIGLDNLNSYYDPVRKRANLAEIRTAAGPAAANFVFLEGDLRDAEQIDAILARDQVAGIAHLAAMAGVRASVDDPKLYLDVNLTGTLNILQAAQRHKVAQIAFASTSSVYGTTTQIPFLETDTCDRPLAPYAASKRAAEMLGYTAHHLHGLNFTALRFFTVYGPRGRPDMMPYKVLDNIFFGRTVPLFNKGQMQRDWTYAGDIVQGVLAALDRPLGYEIINLGRGEPVLVADFIRQIEAVTGRKANLADAPLPDTDVAITYADITKAQKLLGYRPTVSVKQGVDEFWQWYRGAILAQSTPHAPREEGRSPK
jgi:UDP-glucuronate 4-epimerase